MKQENVILVDDKDNIVGYEEKMAAHKKGLMHRAFSVFVFNTDGKMLIQKRAQHKYHCGGLWSNAVCSHPRAGETMNEAVTRRLKEEAGLNNIGTEFLFKFPYRAELDNNLIEHEMDYIYYMISDEIPSVNKEEIETINYIDVQDLLIDIQYNAQHYTPWFLMLVTDVLESVNELKKNIA